MATIKLKSINKEKTVINFHVNLDTRGATGYETDLTLRNLSGDDSFNPKWVAEMTFDNMPPQECAADAVDRMGLYLRQMAKAMKGRNIKHLNIDELFTPIHKN